MTLTETLARTSRALEALGRPHALVGGLAVSVRAEPRFTRDVDFAVVVSSDAEALIHDLRAVGFAPFALVEQAAIGRLASVRLRTADAHVVDLLFASSGIEAAVVASAETLEVAPGVFAPVASVDALTAMKVHSTAPGRRQDDVDLEALLAAGADAARVEGLLRAIEAAGCACDQDLVAKWRAVRDGRAPATGG